MTEAPLVVFSVPDRFEIDGPFVVRAIEERDIPIVAPAFRDPGIGGENGMPPFDEDELRRVLRDLIPEMRARGVLFPYVIEVGYWLFANARGRGLATRAVRAVVREAFASGISRIEANVRIGNEASERVLERAGFTREGVRRHLLRHGDGRVDATLFSLLPDE